MNNNNTDERPIAPAEKRALKSYPCFMDENHTRTLYSDGSTSCTTKSVICLYQKNGQWMSDNSRASNGAELRELFGTDQIPTAFLCAMSAGEVRRQIQVLNPDDSVVIGY